MDRPRLKAQFIAEVVDDSKVFLIGEDQQFLVQGVAAAKVLPYLDGRHTVAEIAAGLSGELSLPETLLALKKYQAFGHLADGRPDLPDHELAYWDVQGIDACAAAAAIEAKEVGVIALGSTPVDETVKALRNAGLRVRSNGEAGDKPADLTVVLVDDYMDPGLAERNAAQLAAGRPWLLAKPVGLVLWLGPLFEPGSTGCWACLAQRLQGNRQIERYLLRRKNSDQPFQTSRAMLGSVPGMFSGLLASEALRIIGAGTSSRLSGRMTTFDIRTLATLDHALIQQPQCPSCGDPSLLSNKQSKVSLTARPVRFDTDGGYRVMPPHETYRRLEKHISPAIGAISTLTTFLESDNGVTYSYTAGHNFAMFGDNLNLLRRNMRGQSGGKGRSDTQARVSAMCEAIERYAGVWHGDEPVIRAPYSEVSETAVHPDEMLGFSAKQVAGRGPWNANPANRLHIVPDPLPSDLTIDWGAAWSLTEERERLVPAAYTWYGHPDLYECFFCFGDSNGCASGNNLEEAILQGFCEVVERDSVSLWWYNRIRRPGVDLDSIGDPYIDTLRAFYARMGRNLWVIDLTTDLGIPTFAGISQRLNHPVEDIIMGFGAHPNPRIAAMRALTEVNQFLPSVERRDADGNTVYLEDDIATLDWWKNGKLAEEPYLLADPDQPLVKMDDYPTDPSNDLADHVRNCVDKAASCGLEVIVLDQTRPDLDLSVVKVMVPGMRHFWRRLGPGRLYQVPVAMGWLPKANSEDELNPRSVFF